MEPNSENAKAARERLVAQCAYRQPTANVNWKLVSRISLVTLSLGFSALGITIVAQPLGAGASICLGGVFMTFAFIV